MLMDRQPYLKAIAVATLCLPTPLTLLHTATKSTLIERFLNFPTVDALWIISPQLRSGLLPTKKVTLIQVQWISASCTTSLSLASSSPDCSLQRATFMKPQVTIQTGTIHCTATFRFEIARLMILQLNSRPTKLLKQSQTFFCSEQFGK